MEFKDYIVIDKDTSRLARECVIMMLEKNK